MMLRLRVDLSQQSCQQLREEEEIAEKPALAGPWHGPVQRLQVTAVAGVSHTSFITSFITSFSSSSTSTSISSITRYM